MVVIAGHCAADETMWGEDVAVITIERKPKDTGFKVITHYSYLNPCKSS
jgi:hypothetical protein